MNRAITKSAISLFIDLSIAVVVSVLALYLRLGNQVFVLPVEFVLNQAFVMMVSVLIANIIFKINLDVWSYFNVDYIIKYVQYAALAVLLFMIGMFLTNSLEMLPRSVIFINWCLIVLFTSLTRFLYRLNKDSEFTFSKLLRGVEIAPDPVLVVGLGRSAERFIQETRSQPGAIYKVVGIVDKKENKGRFLLGVPILGSIDELDKIVQLLARKKLKPIRILVSSDAHLTGKLQDIIMKCKDLCIPLSRLPKLTELAHNISKGMPIQPIALEDLLKRHQKNLNLDEIAHIIKGKKVLITGGGGSIGSEIARQVAQFSPQTVAVLDNSEYLLYDIEQELKLKFPQLDRQVHLVDIRDDQAVDDVFHSFKPDVVFHAAALKHVPLLETHKIEGAKTNIFGTLNLLRASKLVKVKRFVFISTDKAVEPSSFMGATKRVAELCCQAFASASLDISIVRFGNVLGSNGSVVPLFEKQIAIGGPITVTDPEATRYFMTIPEAVGLVLQSAAMQSKATHSQVFILDMGKSIKILDLARHMIQLAGLKPDVDIVIEFTGLRPGEKLHEKLITSNTSMQKTSRDDVMIADVASLPLKKLTPLLKELDELCVNRDDNHLRILIFKVLTDIDGVDCIENY